MARKRRDNDKSNNDQPADSNPSSGSGSNSAIVATFGLTPEEREEIERVNRVVIDARRRLMESKMRLDEARGDAKACQADYDAAVSTMLQVTDEILHPPAEKYPLFVREGQGREPERIAESGRAWQDHEWRPDALKDVIPEVGSQLLHILDESEIRTMGDLADWTATKRLDQIAGIGEAKAKTIEDAVIAYWSRKNQARDAADADADGQGETQSEGDNDTDETAA